VLGQYRGYTETEGVPDDSTTETFVAARLWVDTDRWEGVPFLLRTGKMMAASAQRVSLILKPAEGPLRHVPANGNAIVFDLKGNGAIDVQLTVKKPGPDAVPAESATSLMLQNVAPGAMAPYTSLIHDVLVGNRMLFTSSKGLESSFNAFEPMLTDARPKIDIYEDGSWGPEAAQDLAGDVGWLLEQKVSPSVG